MEVNAWGAQAGKSYTAGKPSQSKISSEENDKFDLYGISV